MRGRISNHYVWRILITFALTIYSYLFVFISGGSIEMHFHFFMIVALLIVYADWRLGWILLVLTGLHHVILNYFEPGWVYFYGRNDFAVVSHAVPVLVAVIFTTILTQNSRRVLVALYEARQGLEATVTERTKQLEEANQSLEQKVNDRTTQLQDKLNEVQELNEVMVGRELKMAEQKEELAQLRKKHHAKDADSLAT
jgi:ABC-type multidrug transport system fused ATPase/permease subunit